MTNLKYNESFADNRDAIVQTLGLNESEEQRLFVDKKPIQITDEQMASLNAMNDEADDEAEETATEEAVTETAAPSVPDTAHPDEDVIDVSIASQRDRDAVNVGEALSVAANKVLVENNDAKEKTNIAPLLFRETMVVDLKAKKIDPNSLPFPNSRREQGKTVVGTGDNKIMLGDNAPWDRYTYTDVNKDNKQVTKKGSYYVSMARSSIEGKKLEAELKLCTDALAALEPGSAVAMPKRYEGFSSRSIGKRKSLYTSRLNGFVTLIKKSVKLHLQCNAFDSLSNIGYEFETEKQKKDGKEISVYVNRNEPITVYQFRPVTVKGKEVLSPVDHFCVSIGAFNRFNVAEAVAKAGGSDKVTLDHLRATVKREKPEEEKKTTAQTLNIAKSEDVDNVYSAINLYFNADDSSVNTKHVAAYLAFLTKTENKQSLLNAGDGIVAQEEIWKQIEKPYYAAVAERTAARLAEQQQKKVASK